MRIEALIRVATVGTFDGLHKGHRKVLEKVMDVARERKLFPAVFTFSGHPLDVIDPARVPGRLMDKDDQQRELRAMGLDVFTIRFNEELRNMSAFDYMRMLRDTYGVAVLVMGYDNRFGRNREASLEEYEEYGRRLGMDVIRTGEVDGVSSSIIRRFLREGEIEKANLALGYTYSLRGRIGHGAALGKTIGFPTANLVVCDNRRLIPANGVYAARAIMPDGTTHGAMVNIGFRPTVSNGGEIRSIEANIFDFNGDIYDNEITLQFVAYIREERKMNSLDELKDQLQADKKAALSLLSE